MECIADPVDFYGILSKMSASCKGRCVDYQCQKMKNGEKYLFCKRCTFCGIFISFDGIRCPCCKIILRTKPRGRISKLRKF